MQVSLCVIPKLPLHHLLDLLPKFNKVGLLKPNSTHSTAVLERLASEETLADNSVGPLETFVAVRRWQISNQNVPGKSGVKQVNPAIEDALQNLHLNSFSVSHFFYLILCYTYAAFVNNFKKKEFCKSNG